ncbi:MAG: glycosyltransferase [Planctomycetota bacterium]
MKVLVFMSQFYLLNGAERLAVELAEELNKRGVHADIVSMYTEDLPGVAEATDDLLYRGIPSVHFLGMRLHPSVTSVVQAIIKLRTLIKEHKYDIVETSVVSPTVIATWATLGMPARHIAGLHQVYRRDRENKKRHKIWRRSLGFNRRTRYYAISDYVASQWVRYSGTPPRHIRRIYNGISNASFNVVSDRERVRKELGVPEESSLAIFVGRLAAYKGIDVLLEALFPVLDERNMYLLYIGEPDLDIEGTGEMLEEMRRALSRENGTSRIKFLGYRKRCPSLDGCCRRARPPSSLGRIRVNARRSDGSWLGCCSNEHRRYPGGSRQDGCSDGAAGGS